MTALIAYAQSGLVAATRSTAGERPEDGRHRVGGLEEPLGARQLLVLDEVRQPRVDGRPEEAGGAARDGGQGHDLPGAARKRQHAEDAEADDVGRNHHAPARVAVDQRADRQAEHDRRQEVGDEERGDPVSRIRAVPDVDRERHEGEPRPEPRAERGKKEQAKAADSAEQVGLPPEQAVHHSREHTEHGGRRLVER